MAVAPVAALVIAIGAAEALRGHRVERAVAIVVLCGFAVVGAWLGNDPVALAVGLGMAACIVGDRAWAFALLEVSAR
jgi:hypothetical protein